MKKAISNWQLAGRWLLAAGFWPLAFGHWLLALCSKSNKIKIFHRRRGLLYLIQAKTGLDGAPACAPLFYCSYNF
jgi:hypothetical protein